MKTKKYIALAATMMATMAAEAQIGQPWIHDPSTLVECDGKYYTFGAQQLEHVGADGRHVGQSV